MAWRGGWRGVGSSEARDSTLDRARVPCCTLTSVVGCPQEAQPARRERRSEPEGRGRSGPGQPPSEVMGAQPRSCDRRGGMGRV